jgi:hypothetical protein
MNYMRKKNKKKHKTTQQNNNNNNNNNYKKIIIKKILNKNNQKRYKCFVNYIYYLPLNATLTVLNILVYKRTYNFKVKRYIEHYSKIIFFLKMIRYK